MHNHIFPLAVLLPSTFPIEHHYFITFFVCGSRVICIHVLLFQVPIMALAFLSFVYFCYELLLKRCFWWGFYFPFSSGHKNWVLCIAWSPDGKHLVSGSKAGELQCWDPQTGNPSGNPLIVSSYNNFSVKYHFNVLNFVLIIVNGVK